MGSARVALIALIAAFEIACAIGTFLTFARPLGVFGYNVGLDGQTVIAVEPELPAARAGIVPGDVVVFESLSQIGRWNAIVAIPVEPGTEIAFTLRHKGSERTVTLRAEPLPGLIAAAELAYAIGGLALGVVSLLLVYLRPNKMTWGFALIAPPLIVPEVSVFLHYGSNVMLTYEAGLSILYGLQTTGMLWFASRFPTDRPEGVNKFIDKLAVPLGAVSAAVYLYVDFTIAYAAAPPPHWVLFTQGYAATVVPAVAAFVALCVTYAAATGGARNRLAPTIATYIAWLIVYTIMQFSNELTTSAAPELTLYFAYALASGLLAASVAYGVVKHRVIDVKFILSRTLVYSGLTLFVVGVFTLIEYIIGKMIEHTEVASTLELVAALGIGVSLNAVHVQLDRIIDRLMFRKRHEAEVRLERAANELAYARSAKRVDEILVAEPADALELASAALFRADEDGPFVRAYDAGWHDDEATEFAEDDHLVVRLRAELKPVHIGEMRWPRADLPTGDRRPLFAVPIAVGHRLEAIALYGAHRSGEDLDPDETRSLRGLAGGAALAYDHLAAEDLRKALEGMRKENEALRAVERKLSDLLGRQLS